MRGSTSTNGMEPSAIQAAATTGPPPMIQQDYEIDWDGEVGAPLDVFWCEGHGHDPADFVRAVVEHCLDYGRDIPRIEDVRRPAELWQCDRKSGDSITYERRESVEGLRRADWRPVTVLDCERRRLGATSCSVKGCTRPVRSQQAFPVVWEPDGEYVALEMRLCDEHRGQIPDQTYRLVFVPVGATIMLEGDR